MRSEQVFEHLQQLGIALTVANNGHDLLITAVPGLMTDELRAMIRQHKRDLILLCCYRVMQWEAGELYGQFPPCYQGLQDGAILALYRTPLEMREHLDRLTEAKNKFENAGCLIDAALHLGGTVEPVMEEGDEFPF